MGGNWDLSDLRELERVVPLQQVLEILRDPLARYALYTLEAFGCLDLEECADVTAAWANASERTITPPTERDRVRTALYHVHLPTLDEVGIVRFDPTSREVALDDNPAELTSFLAGLRGRDLGPDESGGFL